MTSITNILEDLDNLSIRQVKELAAENNIDISLPQKTLVYQLAKRLYKRSKASMPPGGYKTRGEVMNAMARGEISRAEGMKMLKDLKPQTAPPPAECSPPTEAKSCMNDKDYITQECWSESNMPDIKIKFLDPGDYNKKAAVLCLKKADITRALDDDNSIFGRWYPNNIRYPKGQDMDADGYGGRPSQVEQYFRIFDYFLANPINELYNIEAGTFIGYPLYANARMGNIEGTFGMSQLHGQEPGHTIYYIVNAKNSDTKRREALLSGILRINSLKSIRYSDIFNSVPLTLGDNDYTKQILKKYLQRMMKDRSLNPEIVYIEGYDGGQLEVACINSVQGKFNIRIIDKDDKGGEIYGNRQPTAKEMIDLYYRDVNEIIIEIGYASDNYSEKMMNTKQILNLAQYKDIFGIENLGKLWIKDMIKYTLIEKDIIPFSDISVNQNGLPVGVIDEYSDSDSGDEMDIDSDSFSDAERRLDEMAFGAQPQRQSDYTFDPVPFNPDPEFMRLINRNVRE